MTNDRQIAGLLFILLVLLQITMLAASGVAPITQSAGSSAPSAQTSDVLAPAVDTLVRQADTIARAQVITSKNRWNRSPQLKLFLPVVTR